MKQKFICIERYYNIIYIVLVAGSALLYLLLAAGDSLWVDEIYTMEMIRHSFREIWEITAADVHPPLYYVLLKIFTMPFGYSMLPAKIFSVIPFVLIIAAGGIQLRKLFDMKTALLFMILFFFFPYSMPYAVEIRMYSLAALFVFLTAVYAFWCLRRGNWQDWALCAFYGVCSAYTHYFAMVSAGIIYGLLFLAVIVRKKKLLKRWFLMAALVIVLYLPWLKCFAGQLAYKVSHDYWIPRITFNTLLSYVEDIFSARGISVFVFLSVSCYVFALLYMFVRKNALEILIALSALAVPCGTILVGVAASILVRPVFIIRYCIPSIPLLVFFMAFVMGKMSADVMVSVFVAIFAIGGISNYGACIVSEYQTHQTGIDVLLPDAYKSPDTILVCSSDNAAFFAQHVSEMLSYYYPEASIYYPEFQYSAASPYTNLYKFEDFVAGENERIVLLTALHQQVPQEFLSGYNCLYIGEADQYDYPLDAYILYHDR